MQKLQPNTKRKDEVVLVVFNGSVRLFKVSRNNVKEILDKKLITEAALTVAEIKRHLKEAKQNNNEHIFYSDF